MSNTPQWLKDQRMKEYFDGLPAAVQENIMQASVPFSTFDELQQCAQNIKDANT